MTISVPSHCVLHSRLEYQIFSLLLIYFADQFVFESLEQSPDLLG